MANRAWKTNAMKRTKEYLNPERKLVDEVVDWLCGSDRYGSKIVDTPEGARSLAHILVVVPTAQSARNLRLALAQKASGDKRSGILPPAIVMANSLLELSGERVATQAEELSAMAEILLDCDIGEYKNLFPKAPSGRTADWALDMAGVLLEIHKILGEANLLMSEVSSSEDRGRWKDLAGIEKLFIEKLERSGIVARCMSRRRAVASGCRAEGIRQIVLPSAVDVTKAFADYLENSEQDVSVLIHANEEDSAKFDEWGRPAEIFVSGIDPKTIGSAPTAVMETDAIAKYFRDVKDGEAFPALVVCDSEMYPELEGAFQNHFSGDELVLRNPSKENLSRSSLGRLLGAIVKLGDERDYNTFSALIRTGDMARWAQGALSASAGEIASFAGALDIVQNARLPRTLDDVISGAATEMQNARREEDKKAIAGLLRLAETVEKEIGEPFEFLKKIFSCVVLSEKNPADRELAAAAKTVRDIREACASEAIPAFLRRKIFARLLKSSSYMLEPAAENVLVASGWLEAPWCPDDEVVFAGFNEGCVPENIVGHPFVPDALRKQLGISTNSRREMRDSFILAQALKCRSGDSVRVWMHQVSGDKNVMKPSRILFNAIGDKDVPDLALRLYAVTKGNEGAPMKELPPAWRLKLPFPPKGTVYRQKISPTELDGYLRCPFTFYLNETFGSRSDDRRQELDSLAFGNLCHEVLDKFALEGPKDSVDSGEIAAFLEDEVRRKLQSFGLDLPAIVELQGEGAIERLNAFSVLQAARRRAGWRIVRSEQTLECRIKRCPTLVRGRVDRIDEHEKTGDLAIIDYKTWRKARDFNYNSIQLPVYRSMIEASGLFDAAKAHSCEALYCVLAERPEDVAFDVGHAYREGNQSEAEDKIVALLENIAKGIFYPPQKAPGSSDWVWMSDYSQLIWETPEKGVDPEWIDDQSSRMEGGI